MRPVPMLFIAAILLLLQGCYTSEIVRPPDRQLPEGYAWVIFTGDTILAEVADTPSARSQGLRGRTELGEGEGMLFVFDEEEILSFWMQGTSIPLDIGFLDATLLLVDLQQMTPLSEEVHNSASPALFAIEVSQGWFASRQVAVGERAALVFGPR